MYINKPNFHKPVRVAKVPDYETIPNQLYNDLYTAINENNNRGALIRVEAGFYNFGELDITVSDTIIAFDEGVVVEITIGAIALQTNAILKGNAIFQASNTITVPYLLLIGNEQVSAQVEGITFVSVAGGSSYGGSVVYCIDGAGSVTPNSNKLVIKGCTMIHQVASGESFPVIRAMDLIDIALIDVTIKSNSNGVYMYDSASSQTPYMVCNNVIMDLGGTYYLDSENDVEVFAVNTYVTKPMGSTASITERITDGLTVEQYVKAY